MSSTLKQSIDHYFSVFRNNVEYDLHQFLSPSPEAKAFQVAFEDNLDDFRTALLSHLKDDGLI